MCLRNNLVVWDKYDLILQSGKFSLGKVEAFLCYFALKNPFFTLCKLDFSTLKIYNSKNQNTHNDLKETLEKDALENIRVSSVNHVVS